jgi:hypothetical protein
VIPGGTSLASATAPVYGHHVTRWCRLAVLFVVLAAVVYPHRAWAATAAQLETRVRVIELVAHVLVGGSSTPTPEKHRGSSAAYDEIAPGYTLAAEAAPNIVYRGLAAGEDAAAGLVARAPEAGNSIASHVAGARASQWISTTRSLDVATRRFGANGVVAIDLSKVGSQVVDLTSGIPGIGPNTMLSRWAINAQEVLIHGSVPAGAITPVP